MSSPSPARENAAPAASLSPSLMALTPCNQNSPSPGVSSEPTGHQYHAPSTLPPSSQIPDTASPGPALDDATAPNTQVTSLPLATSKATPPTTTTSTTSTTAITSAALVTSGTIPAPSPPDTASDDAPVLAAKLNSSMPTQSQVTPPVATPRPQSNNTRRPSMPDSRATSDPGPPQNKRPLPHAFSNRQHGSSLLTQALATARGIPHLPHPSPATADEAPPNATQLPAGAPSSTPSGPGTTLTLPFHPAPNTLPPADLDPDLSIRNRQDDLSQETESSLISKAANLSDAAPVAPSLSSPNAATPSAPSSIDTQHSAPSNPCSEEANLPSGTMLLGNHGTMSTLGGTTVDRFERERREMERQKAALTFSHSHADGLDAPQLTHAHATGTTTDRASTFPIRKEPTGSEEVPPTNLRRSETRYSLGPEKMWSIGADDLDGDQDGHVEKSVAKALSKAEPNNRSRKTSHTLGFFREALPEEKAKKKDTKAASHTRDRPATRSQTLSSGKDVIFEEQAPAADSVIEGVTAKAINGSETAVFSPAEQAPLSNASRFNEGMKPPANRQGDTHDEKLNGSSPGDQPSTGDVNMKMRLPGETEGEPSSNRRGSTDSLESRDQQDMGEDSGEEKISSAVFLPHQDPQGTDDEKCRIPAPRPATRARSHSRSQDYKTWLVKAGEPEPEDSTPPPTPPTQKASLHHRHGQTSAESKTSLLSDGPMAIDEPEQVARDVVCAPAQPGVAQPDDRPYDNLTVDEQPLEAIELIPYKHQVGGHTTIWRFSKRAVCKQLNNRENEFYETVERYHRDLLSFLPRYIGVLNVTFHKLPRRKTTIAAQNGQANVDKNSIEQAPAKSHLDSTGGVGEDAAKNVAQSSTTHRRVVSQSFANTPMQVPTVTFDDNRHIIPRHLLQPELASFPMTRYRSASGSGALGPFRSRALDRPGMDMRTRSWGATMVNKKLRNEVFNDAFLKQPVAVQKHRRPHRRPPVPRPSGVPNHPPLRPANSDSRLASLERQGVAAETEGIPSNQPPTPFPAPAGSNLRFELSQPCEMEGVISRSLKDEVKDVTGTSAPEPETMVDKVMSQKRKRRYSGSGLRRKPQVGSDSRGDLKYFEEADQVSYQDEDVTPLATGGTKPLAIPDTSGLVGPRPSEFEFVQSPTALQAAEHEPGFKIPRPINPKEAQTQRDSRVEYFLLLEDLTAGMKRPCIMDLKMGTRQYGVDATPKKRESQKGKCARTTSRELGVRVCGLQVWDAHSQTYIFRDKYEGRRLKAGAEFQEALTRFLYNGLDYYSILKHIPTILRKLDELQRIVRGLRGYRFYAASLLMFYDGDTSSEASDYDTGIDDSTTDAATDAEDAPVFRRRKKNKREVDFKIADFANSITAASDVQDRPCPPQFPEDPDGGFLRGLSTLKTYFLKIQRDTRAELGIEPLARGSKLEEMSLDDEDEGFVSE